MLVINIEVDIVYRSVKRECEVTAWSGLTRRVTAALLLAARSSMRLDAGVPDQTQRVAGGAAVGIMIDDYVHRLSPVV